MTYSCISFDVTEGICTITVNRPDKLNALNKTVFDELDHAMDQVYVDDGIKAVMITGSGNKAFVAGADISEFLDIPVGKGKDLAARGLGVFFKIEDCPKPVVAAVNGFALGGGCELAMACHFRYASENARFGQPEVNLGLIPGYGGTQRLTNLVGKGRAMELIMAGKIISAQEALAMGLVNSVFPAEELLAKVKEVLSLIMTKSPVAVDKAIRAINAFDHTRAGFSEETMLFGEAFQSDDMKEGASAFLEKRKPVFKGK